MSIHRKPADAPSRSGVRAKGATGILRAGSNHGLQPRAGSEHRRRMGGRLARQDGFEAHGMAGDRHLHAHAEQPPVRPPTRSTPHRAGRGSGCRWALPGFGAAIHRDHVRRSRLPGIWQPDGRHHNRIARRSFSRATSIPAPHSCQSAPARRSRSRSRATRTSASASGNSSEGRESGSRCSSSRSWRAITSTRRPTRVLSKSVRGSTMSATRNAPNCPTSQCFSVICRNTRSRFPPRNLRMRPSG